MRINVVVNSFPTPSETFIFNLVVGLETKNIDVLVVASKKSSYNSLYKLRLDQWSKNITYLDYFTLFKFSLLSISKNFTEIVFLSRKIGLLKALYNLAVCENLLYNKPDIVYFSFSGIAVRYLEIIDYLNKHTKTLVSCRGTGEIYSPIVEKDRDNKLNKLFSKVSAVHCVSNNILTTCIKYGLVKSKSFINYPSININNYRYNNQLLDYNTNDGIKILTTGRLSFEKGYIFALQACTLLKQNGFNFTYHILGDGPDRQKLLFLIHYLGLENNVFLVGRVGYDDVSYYLQQSNIFLLPSIYEGISNASLEALAVGVPLVTTNAGGMSEVITDGFNGTLVPFYDGIAIFDAIKKIINNYDKALLMSREGRKTIEDYFNHDKQINIFINEFNKLIHV